MDTFICIAAQPGFVAKWGEQREVVLAWAIKLNADSTFDPPVPITPKGSPDEEWVINPKE